MVLNMRKLQIILDKFTKNHIFVALREGEADASSSFVEETA